MSTTYGEMNQVTGFWNYQEILIKFHIVPIDYNASVYAFCSKSRKVTRDVNPSTAQKVREKFPARHFRK